MGLKLFRGISQNDRDSCNLPNGLPQPSRVIVCTGAISPIRNVWHRYNFNLTYREIMTELHCNWEPFLQQYTGNLTFE